jgi:hypothetical protein
MLHKPFQVSDINIGRPREIAGEKIDDALQLPARLPVSPVSGAASPQGLFGPISLRPFSPEQC